MKTRTWKVGDIAKATGITVRTLHHYEEIGSLEASGRTESEHRIYSEGDVQRLQQILSLKQLGFPLEDIRKCLNDKDLSPLQIVRLHQKRVVEEHAQLGQLSVRLEMLEKSLAGNSKPSVEELLKTIEVITMYDKYFTKEQMEEIKQRRDTLGEDKVREYQESWKDLTSKVRAAMQAKTDPSSPEAQKLARRWREHVAAFTGGNAHIEVQLGSMYRNEPTMREKAGMDPELTEYVARMMSFLQKLG